MWWYNITYYDNETVLYIRNWRWIWKSNLDFNELYNSNSTSETVWYDLRTKYGGLNISFNINLVQTYLAPKKPGKYSAREKCGSLITWNLFRLVRIVYPQPVTVPHLCQNKNKPPLCIFTHFFVFPVKNWVKTYSKRCINLAEVWPCDWKKWNEAIFTRS